MGPAGIVVSPARTVSVGPVGTVATGPTSGDSIIMAGPPGCGI